MVNKRKTKSPFIRESDDLGQKVGHLEASQSECDRVKTESERVCVCIDRILGSGARPERFPVSNANLKILSAGRSIYNMFNGTPKEPVGKLNNRAWAKNYKQKGSGYDLCS